jgi:hypothetical protein
VSNLTIHPPSSDPSSYRMAGVGAPAEFETTLR